MSRFQSLCEKRFHLAQNQTNLHTEVLAGLTTFATMSYVLAVSYTHLTLPTTELV